MKVITDPATARWWAATIEAAVGHWWLVLWEPGGQHLTAYYRGHWVEGGIHLKGRTPGELWPLLVQTQAEGRRRALAERVDVPPLLMERLPDALHEAVGR